MGVEYYRRVLSEFCKKIPSIWRLPVPFQVLSPIDCISAGFKTRRDRNFQQIVFISSVLHNVTALPTVNNPGCELAS